MYLLEVALWALQNRVRLVDTMYEAGLNHYKTYSKANLQHWVRKKIKYTLSYLPDDGFQWWETVNLNNQVNIATFKSFQIELLKFFEPVNMEVNARETLSSWEQTGALNPISAFNAEVTKLLLQIPTMANDEQILHYSQGLKNRMRLEIERSEITSLTDAMRIADRIDSIYTRGSFPYQGGFGNGVTPMDVPQKYKFVKLSAEEKVQFFTEGKCFICKNVGCRASKHKKKKRKTQITFVWCRPNYGVMFNSRRG